MRKKVIFISEYLNPPYDEGIKKTAYNLFLNLDKNYDLLAICRHGYKKDNIHVVDTNALYYSKEIKSIIKEFNPDSLIYLPFQSSTFASYIRLKVFSVFAENTKVALIALQPKPLKKWQQFLIKFIKPKTALTPSPTLSEFWNKSKINNQQVPLLTDLSVFKSISGKEKKGLLRAKYGLPIDAYIVSHMGHLNEGRNLKTLIPLQSSGIQIVIAASTSTPDDAKGHQLLKNEILESGIIILDRYLESIEELYQLSDAYIFPVIKKNSSIGMPLSILEARACAIPVVTTDYGSIKTYMDNDFGGIVYSQPENFLNAVNIFRNNKKRDYFKTNVNCLNNQFYKIIYKLIEE